MQLTSRPIRAARRLRFPLVLQAKQPLILYRLGKAYQLTGRFRDAALQYETLARKFPEGFANQSLSSGDEVPWALQQAALLRRSLGEADTAIEAVRLIYQELQQQT